MNLTTPHGVVGTPVTPFTRDNRLDVDRLAMLVNFLVGTGIDFLSLPMHIGESLNLRMDERKRVAEAAIETVADRIPVFVHVSTPGTDEAVELARHAQTAGAAGIVVVTPYYWAPSPPALVEHFATIASSVELGMVAYNFPKKLGTEIDVDLLVELITRIPTLVGLKDASFDMEYFTDVCRVSAELRPAFGVLTGIEYLLPSMVVGGVGTFSGCGAVAPRLVRSLYDACAAGDYSEARQLQYRISRLWHVIKVNYPAGIKAAMDIVGRPAGESRLPIAPLSTEMRAQMRRELEKMGILDSEPLGW